ncbi:unnamed protein product, partial [Musa banksii]
PASLSSSSRPPPFPPPVPPPTGSALRRRLRALIAASESLYAIPCSLFQSQEVVSPSASTASSARSSRNEFVNWYLDMIDRGTPGSINAGAVFTSVDISLLRDLPPIYPFPNSLLTIFNSTGQFPI